MSAPKDGKGKDGKHGKGPGGGKHAAKRDPKPDRGNAQPRGFPWGGGKDKGGKK